MFEHINDAPSGEGNLEYLKKISSVPTKSYKMWLRNLPSKCYVWWEESDKWINLNFIVWHQKNLCENLKLVSPHEVLCCNVRNFLISTSFHVMIISINNLNTPFSNSNQSDSKTPKIWKCEKVYWVIEIVKVHFKLFIALNLILKGLKEIYLKLLKFSSSLHSEVMTCEALKRVCSNLRWRRFVYRGRRRESITSTFLVFTSTNWDFHL